MTPENFAAWKEAFDKEMRAAWLKEDEAEIDMEKSKRLSGRQYFEQHAGSASFLAALEAEAALVEDGDGDALKDGVGVVDQSLYGDDEIPSDED